MARERSSVVCSASNDKGGGWGIGKLLDSTLGALFRFGGEPGQKETVEELDKALAAHVEIAAVRGVIQRRLEDEVSDTTGLARSQSRPVLLRLFP